MQKNRVSIIFVNYNGVEYIGQSDLERAIKSFLNTDYSDFEFIFVDNASEDTSIAIANNAFSSFPRIKTKVINTGFNAGFSGGCNKAIKEATGEYLCLVNNDDCAIGKDWLAPLIKQLTLHADAGAIFGKKMKWDSPTEIDACGLTMNAAAFISGTKLKDKFAECLIWQTPVVFNRSLLPKIGGYFFDDDYVILNDDTDSSLRIWLSGFKIYYEPSSVVLHKRSATMKHLPVEFVAFHGRKNTLQTILKCYNLKHLLLWFPVSLSMFVTSIPYYLMKGRVDQAKATWRALSWILKNFKNILKKRNIIKHKVRVVDDSAFFHLFTKYKPIKILLGNKIWPK